MAERVAPRVEHSAAAFDGHAEKALRGRCRFERVDGDLDIAVRAVLEADGRRETAGDFAMGLGLGRARADGGPGNEIAQILWCNRVERFRSGAEPELRKSQEKLPRHAEPLGDAEGVVHVRVVNEAFPSDARARLFEVDAHDDEERVVHFIREAFEPIGIFHRGVEVVDRARPDDDEQARILLGQDLTDRVPGLEHGLLCLRSRGILLAHLVWGGDELPRRDIGVIEDAFVHRKNVARGNGGRSIYAL